jgi:hypothetical protein
MRLCTAALPRVVLCRNLTDSLQRLMQAEYGFAQEGDVATAVQGLGTAGAAGTDGVAQACRRAAMAHRLYCKRLLPRLKVSAHCS